MNYKNIVILNTYDYDIISIILFLVFVFHCFFREKPRQSKRVCVRASYIYTISKWNRNTK